MNYFVYILYSPSTQLFYVGATKNLNKRLYYHNQKKNKGFTANGKPWIILWSTHKPSKTEAEILEQKLKNLSKERKIIFMQKYHQGVHDIDLMDSLNPTKS